MLARKKNMFYFYFCSKSEDITLLIYISIILLNYNKGIESLNSYSDSIV